MKHLVSWVATLWNLAGLRRVVSSVLLAALPGSPLVAGPIEVTSTADSGVGTLRTAITTANGNPGPNTISFAPAVSGIITLASPLPGITDTLDIAGPGTDLLAVSGNNANRVFEIGSGTAVTITAVTTRDGDAGSGYGGGIFTDGTLVLSDTVVISNSAGLYGGGVYVNYGSAILSDTVVSGNTAVDGGAIHQDLETASVQVTDSCIAGNSDTSVNNATTGSDIVAENNWWGTRAGPSGAGPGWGDSVSAGVVYTPFLTESIMGCPSYNVFHFAIMLKNAKLR